MVRSDYRNNLNMSKTDLGLPLSRRFEATDGRPGLTKEASVMWLVPLLH
jgi:hypothetical protein